MAGNWNFQQNCWVDLWLNTAGIPAVAPTYSGLLAQRMKPYYSGADAKGICYHRVIIPVATSHAISSTDIVNGIVITTFDSAPNAWQYLDVDDVSPFFYLDPGGNPACDYQMLMCWMTNA